MPQVKPDIETIAKIKVVGVLSKTNGPAPINRGWAVLIIKPNKLSVVVACLVLIVVNFCEPLQNQEKFVWLFDMLRLLVDIVVFE